MSMCQLNTSSGQNRSRSTVDPNERTIIDGIAGRHARAVT
jgi:hypothetical protein